MKKFEFEGAPLVLAFVLGPLLETGFKTLAYFIRWELVNLRAAATISSFYFVFRRCFGSFAVHQTKTGAWTQ
jgi:TctA family transporter